MALIGNLGAMLNAPSTIVSTKSSGSKTMQTRIHDTVNGEAADISLAVAIDLMFPCNWNFVDNLDAGSPDFRCGSSRFRCKLPNALAALP